MGGSGADGNGVTMRGRMRPLRKVRQRWFIMRKKRSMVTKMIMRSVRVRDMLKYNAGFGWGEHATDGVGARFFHVYSWFNY